jgi:hypothetical protein
MPTESEIIKIRVQDALCELSRIETPNIRLAARLYNASFCHGTARDTRYAVRVAGFLSLFGITR